MKVYFFILKTVLKPYFMYTPLNDLKQIKSLNDVKLFSHLYNLLSIKKIFKA